MRDIITQNAIVHVDHFGEYVVHLLILVIACLLAAITYAWGLRASKEKWELVRTLSGGKLGIYKRRQHQQFGKFERSLATYAVMRNGYPGKIWSFVWRVTRVERGGRITGLRDMPDTAGQESLHEIGFAPPLGIYTIYTGEEDHLSYPAREQHVLALYKKTAIEQKKWHNDTAFFVRNTISRWRASLFVFISIIVVGMLVAPPGVETQQVAGWTLIGALGFGLAVGIVCIMKTYHCSMWAQASSAATLVAGLVALSVLPPSLLGINAFSFSTLCEGSAMVERSWSEGSGENTVYYADVPLPSACQFEAQRVPINTALYNELQSGRRVVDVIVSKGILGYKRIKLIGT